MLVTALGLKKLSQLSSSQRALLAGTAGITVTAIAYFLFKDKVDRKIASFHSDESLGGVAKIGGKVVISKTVLVNKPRSELFSLLSNVQNLPAIFNSVESVDTSGNQSSWKIKSGSDDTFLVATEFIETIENERFVWRSTGHSDIACDGYVAFRDGPPEWGTYVEVVIRYRPSARTTTRLVNRLFRRKPALAVLEQLNNVKRVLDDGGRLSQSERQYAAHY